MISREVQVVDAESKVLDEKVIELRDKHLGRNLVEFLTSPTPEEFIDERKIGGGRSAKYIYGHYFIKKLNESFGFLWSYEIPEHFVVGKDIVVKGQLTIHIPGHTFKKTFPDGTYEETRVDSIEIKKTQWGGSEVKKYSQDVRNSKTNEITYHKGDVIDLANDYKAASTDGLKKCGTELGIGLDIYGASREKDESGISKEQLDAIIMRGSRAGMDETQTLEWAEKELGKKQEDWEKIEAMALIPKLIIMARSIPKKG